jgi:hypothetical protein
MRDRDSNTKCKIGVFFTIVIYSDHARLLRKKALQIYPNSYSHPIPSKIGTRK